MSCSNTARHGCEPARHTVRPAHRVGDARPVIKVTLTVTSDSPDGQPWPPTERNILWRLVRRADDCSCWRAIELAESDPLPRTFAISLGQQSQLKGSQHEEG